MNNTIAIRAQVWGSEIARIPRVHNEAKIMKIDGYRCRICENKEFIGKGGKWVCSQCFTPVPVSLLPYMEFDDHRPLVRIVSDTMLVR
jgi:hypothetical protein